MLHVYYNGYQHDFIPFGLYVQMIQMSQCCCYLFAAFVNRLKLSSIANASKGRVDMFDRSKRHDNYFNTTHEIKFEASLLVQCVDAIRTMLSRCLPPH